MIIKKYFKNMIIFLYSIFFVFSVFSMEEQRDIKSQLKKV
jgi:hypothetical protein